MSLTQFSLDGNNLIIPGQAGDEKTAKLFLQCTSQAPKPMLTYNMPGSAPDLVIL
jgi:hypothetical protein